MPIVDPAPAPPPIAETDVFALHEQLLLHALEQLRAKRKIGQHTRAEIEAWIADESERPFSFATCARVCGCDPDRLRQTLAYYLRRRSA